MKTTILVEKETRERLRQLGRKSQTYNQLIVELIENTAGKYVSDDCKGSQEIRSS